LPIIANQQQLAALMAEINTNEGVKFTVDLENQELITPAGNGFKFEIDPFRKENLLKGLDDIGLTLQHESEISTYETRHKQMFPWLWNS
jgi:3-isopropylmalate/(R)-2-methylmalate dehydratase small subunit